MVLPTSPPIHRCSMRKSAAAVPGEAPIGQAAQRVYLDVAAGAAQAQARAGSLISASVLGGEQSSMGKCPAAVSSGPQAEGSRRQGETGRQQPMNEFNCGLTPEERGAAEEEAEMMSPVEDGDRDGDSSPNVTNGWAVASSMHRPGPRDKRQ